MIIDDTLLIQVYSTVLVGVLIFFTIQRHFQYHDDFKTESRRLLKDRTVAYTEMEIYQDELRRLENSRAKNVRDAPERFNHPDSKKEYESEKNRLKCLVKERGKDAEAATKEMHSRAMIYRKRRNQYMSLRTDEGIVALAMIILMVTSIIVLLIGSVIEINPFHNKIPPTARIISVVLFSIAIILLIVKVYLHGKDID